MRDCAPARPGAHARLAALRCALATRPRGSSRDLRNRACSARHAHPRAGRPRAALSRPLVRLEKGLRAPRDGPCGFGDIEVNVSGGYGPTETPADAPLIRAQIALLKRSGLDPLLWVRNAGSYPGYVFTGEPLKLASGHYGLGHGSGAHAPDEYYVIESTNPKVSGYDDAARSFVDYLYELAVIR